MGAKILEWLWPKAVTEQQLNPAHIFGQYQVAKDQISASAVAFFARLFDLSKSLAEAECKRREHIEARASASVTIIGIALAILGGLLSMISSLHLARPVLIATVVISLLAMIYLLSSISSALSVYGASPTHVLGPTDLVPRPGENESAYSTRMSSELIGNTIENYKSNNRLLSRVFLSQERFKRGVFLLALAAVLIMLGHLKNESAHSGATADRSQAQTVNQIHQDIKIVPDSASTSAPAPGSASSKHRRRSHAPGTAPKP